MFYTILIAFLITGICTIVFIILTQNIENNEIRDMNNVTALISEQLNLRIKEMNQISFGVLTNTYVRQSLLYLSGYNYETVNMLMYLSSYNMITDNIFTISQPFPDIDRVNVFSDSNMYFSSKRFDTDSGEVRKQLLSRPKPGDIKLEAGYSYRVLPPHDNEWEEDSGEKIFSLQRVVQSSHGPIGIIEVQAKYNIIAEICNISPINSGRIFILDRSDNFIYSGQSSTDNSDEKLINDYKNAEKMSEYTAVKFIEQKSGIRYVAVSRVASYPDWIVLYMIPRTILNEPIFNILRLIIIIGIFGTAISFVIAYIIALHIYTPLRELKKKVENIDYQNINPDMSAYAFSNVDGEIAILNRSFDKMALKLKNSLDETIQTQQQIEKAYYKLLQSQMNPHFLHNTISVISIMAKNLGDGKIPDICSKLNTILKYTSDISENYVTLRAEKENIDSFLGLLKYRYEHRMEYKIVIEDQLQNKLLPRMTLQPFVENCFKHGMYGLDRAIEISVFGRQTDDGWEIVISDDGTGIDEGELKRIKDEIYHFDNSSNWLNDNVYLKSSKLGILNTFIRLKLLYDEQLVFDIHNIAGSGSEIKIHIKEIQEG